MKMDGWKKTLKAGQLVWDCQSAEMSVEESGIPHIIDATSEMCNNTHCTLYGALTLIILALFGKRKTLL